MNSLCRPNLVTRACISTTSANCPCPPGCCQVYKRVLEKPVTEQRVAGICQRENSFYVDTVRGGWH